MKLTHLIAASALTVLASGSVLAQIGGNNGAGSPPSSAANTAQSALGGAKDKAKDAKNKSGQPSTKDMKGAPNNPISVTPPSQDDPNATANVDTDPADATARAGQSGVSANANVQGSTNGQNPTQPVTDKAKPVTDRAKPVTDKLKTAKKNSDHQ